MRFGWPSFIDVQFPLSRNETFCGPGHFQKRGNGGVFRGQMVPFVELLGDNDAMWRRRGEILRDTQGYSRTACCRSRGGKVQIQLYSRDGERDHAF